MNLNLVIDTSQFKPFDISPALQILRDYRDAYYKYQDRLDKIAEENGQYILPDTEDNKAYKDIMSKYNADFEAAASDFSKHMNLQNQRDLLNLFRRQRSEITPINKAIEAYNKDVDKITALGPDVTIANRNNRKISDYYGGVNPGLNYRNNKSIQSAAAGVMQGLDNALMSSPEIAGDIANQYYILKQQGIDGNDALQRILRDKPYLNTEEGVRGASQVMDALNTVYNQFAFDEGTPENKQIWEQVVTGAIQGIQAPKYSLHVNRNFESDADRASREYTELQRDYYRQIKDLEEEEKNLKLGKVKNDNGKYEYNPTKAKEILQLRYKEQASSSQPYFPYKGHRYSIKKSKGEFGDADYNIVDLDTNEQIGEASPLHNEIVNAFDGGVEIEEPEEEGHPLGYNGNDKPQKKKKFQR